MNPDSMTAQNSRSSSCSNHFDSRSFWIATVWLLPPKFVEGFNFDVKNHQWDLGGDLEAGSGPLNEFRRGGIMISVANTIALDLRSSKAIKMSKFLIFFSRISANFSKADFSWSRVENERISLSEIFLNIFLLLLDRIWLAKEFVISRFFSF